MPYARSGSGYREAEAKLEAGRCLQCECMECVKVCVYLERFKSYPKRYIRQIYNNETILIGSHGADEQAHQFVQPLRPLRRGLSQRPFHGPGLHGREGESCKEEQDAPFGPRLCPQDMRSGNSEKSALSRHEPGKDRSAYVFFPGCQLGAMNPDHVTAVICLSPRTPARGRGAHVAVLRSAWPMGGHVRTSSRSPLQS